jgi:hypothetical protein
MIGLAYPSRFDVKNRLFIWMGVSNGSDNLV